MLNQKATEHSTGKGSQEGGCWQLKIICALLSIKVHRKQSPVRDVSGENVS